MYKLIFVLVLSMSAFCAPKKTTLYVCVDNKFESKIDRIAVYTYKKGSRVFYDAKINFLLAGEEKVMTRALNFLSEYNGNVITFSRAGLGLKIYKAIGKEKKYKSFVRVSELGVHSDDWTCKEY